MDKECTAVKLSARWTKQSSCLNENTKTGRRLRGKSFDFPLLRHQVQRSRFGLTHRKNKPADAHDCHGWRMETHHSDCVNPRTIQRAHSVDHKSCCSCTGASTFFFPRSKRGDPCSRSRADSAARILRALHMQRKRRKRKKRRAFARKH